MRKLLSWPVVASLVLLILVVVAVALLRHRPGTPPPAGPIPSPLAVATPLPPPVLAAPTGPGGFVPLQSQAVKDAIHRALSSGTTQRWQDGALSGYAVPSLSTGANGCRAVRYTIDQQPGAPYGSITACDASAR